MRASPELALEKFGAYALRKALAPGIALVRDGFEVSATLAGGIQATEPLLRRDPGKRPDRLK